MANRNSSPLTLFIMGVVFIISGWMVHKHFSMSMVKEAEVSEKWPTASGVVTHADISQYKNSDGNLMYAADINYEFIVDNKSYIGDRVSLSSSGSSTSSLNSVKKILQTYPIDTDVTVYYDPELPNNAVLEPGADFFIYIIKYTPWIFIFFGVLMLWQLVKKVGILILAFFISRRN